MPRATARVLQANPAPRDSELTFSERVVRSLLYRSLMIKVELLIYHCRIIPIAGAHSEPAAADQRRTSPLPAAQRRTSLTVRLRLVRCWAVGKA